VIRGFYERASAAEVRLVAEAFADATRQHRPTCYACAIMPDHVHVLIRKHRHKAEGMIQNLQAASRSRLVGKTARSEGICVSPVAKVHVCARRFARLGAQRGISKKFFREC
jgi:REP element-mobilizing transposase RayT